MGPGYRSALASTPGSPGSAPSERGHVELTAVGDVVNTAARLASAAGPGEVLVSADAAAAADLDPGIARRPLDLKGKEFATEVVSLRVDPPAAQQPRG